MRYSGPALHLAQSSLTAPFVSPLQPNRPPPCQAIAYTNYVPFPDYSMWPLRVLNTQLLGRVPQRRSTCL